MSRNRKPIHHFLLQASATLAPCPPQLLPSSSPSGALSDPLLRLSSPHLVRVSWLLSRLLDGELLRASSGYLSLCPHHPDNSSASFQMYSPPFLALLRALTANLWLPPLDQPMGDSCRRWTGGKKDAGPILPPAGQLLLQSSPPGLNPHQLPSHCSLLHCPFSSHAPRPPPRLLPHPCSCPDLQK